MESIIIGVITVNYLINLRSKSPLPHREGIGVGF